MWKDIEDLTVVILLAISVPGFIRWVKTKNWKQ